MYRAVAFSAVLVLCTISSALAEEISSPARPSEPSSPEGASFLNNTKNTSSEPSTVSTADLVSLSKASPDPYLLYDLGRYEEVLKIYNGSVEGGSSNPEVWYYRGNTLGQMGRYEEAIESFNEVIDLVPSFSGSWRLIGISYYHMERYDDAIYYYDRAIALDDDYARGAKKEALRKLGRNSEADKISGRWDPLSGYLQSIPDMELRDYLHKKRML
jgi:tetratricopeptide (TPR) repeat protein